MACILIDNYRYRRWAHRPDIPKAPLCMPLREYVFLWLRRFFIIIVTMIIVIAFPAYMERLAADAGSASLADKIFFIQLFSWIIVPGGAVYAIYKDRDLTYKRLQNSERNPLGCRCQGKVLNTSDPHYQLHLDYYKAHKTWILPDAPEDGAGMPKAENR